MVEFSPTLGKWLDADYIYIVRLTTVSRVSPFKSL